MPMMLFRAAVCWGRQEGAGGEEVAAAAGGAAADHGPLCVCGVGADVPRRDARLGALVQAGVRQHVAQGRPCEPCIPTIVENLTS